VKQKILAKRYAQATLNTLSADKYHDVFVQIEIMKQLINENPKLGEIVRSKLVKNEAKIEFLSNILANVPDKEFWMKIFKVMILKNRSEIMILFLYEFDSLLKAHLQMKDVKLILAHEQDQKTLDTIREEIEGFLKSKVLYKIQMDKKILGGFIAISDNKMIDASVLTSLNRFARRRVKW